MILLRLLADILLYLALGLVAYWFFTKDITALWIAIASGVVSFILFIVTADIKQSRRQRHSDPSTMWDWLYFIELLEIPFQIMLWLLRGLWRIFD